MIGKIALIGQKAGMVGVYNNVGEYVPVTLIKVDTNVVLDIRTEEKDGYTALVVCGNNVKEKSLAKPQKGLYSKINSSEYKKTIKEFRTDFDVSAKLPGTSFNITEEMLGELVDVQSKSIGKGFQGPMKRHGFAGLSASHGVSVSHRSHGSTGNLTSQGKVHKGKKMAGRMGGKTNTCQNLEIVTVDTANNIIGVKGSISGYNGTVVVLQSAVKKYKPASTLFNGVDLKADVNENIA